MPSPHWAEVRFLVPPLSKWRAISSDMKVFKSTSWSPFLLRPPLEPLLTWVGEPGVLERTLMLAMAPLRPGGGGEEKPMLAKEAAFAAGREMRSRDGGTLRSAGEEPGQQATRNTDHFLLSLAKARGRLRTFPAHRGRNSTS